MKRTILSALVVIITLITVVAMTTFKNDYAPQTYNTIDEVQQNNISDGTGYIFDDFGKGINLSLN
ncbi:hypothetical protein SAMN05443428_10178 [Caloramator quimbayensis]|uniref:Uncharacterized protein n=1 Tax=Caloramator quimbayensis TaxID=1147123 RepID=A0A1T4WFC9_9CLOT|nr:hypothetical protein [Caloramator quimbayensis]SKA75708.1 hypothetical protein SAMN05443428_10178 [Caloramator quimbayensis]